MKAIGGLLIGVGALLVLVAFIWGRVGFFVSELPILIGLAVAGIVLGLIGAAITGAGDGTPAPAEPAAPGPKEEPSGLASVLPPSAEQRAADPTTPAADLADLAHRERALRPLVAANPSAYAALLDWLAALDDPAVNAALAARSERRASGDETLLSRASDPATPPAELADLAHQHPELRQAIADNPAAYPALREWIAAAD